MYKRHIDIDIYRYISRYIYYCLQQQNVRTSKTTLFINKKKKHYDHKKAIHYYKSYYDPFF